MKSIFHHISRFKYLYTLLLFAVWMAFFDDNSISNQYDLKSRYMTLLKQKKFYLTEIATNQKLSDALDSDTALMEKIAREKYLMKRDGEVIYLIVDEEIKVP